MGLKYMPIGKVKISKGDYWREKYEELNKAVNVLMGATFVLGMFAGALIGAFL